MTKCFLSLIAAFIFSIQALNAEEQKNLIINPDFSLKNEDGSVKGWIIKGNAYPTVEDGRQCIKIDGTDESAEAEVYVPLKPEWTQSDKISVTLRVSAWIKTDNVQLGDAAWKDTRLAMQFLDADNKMAGNWPDVLCVKGTTPWTLYQRDFKIPEGAAKLKLDATNFGKTGVAYFTDIKVIPVILSMSTEDLPKPEEVKDLWNLENAWTISSSARKKICLNDLWRFRPLFPDEKFETAENVKSWGWAKIPDLWRQKRDWETGAPGFELMLPPFLKAKMDWTKTTQAWYKRELTLPSDWKNKHVFLEFTLVQTHAEVFIDNKPVGEVWFPGGEVELTEALTPGTKQTLSILLTARPMAEEKKIFMDADRVFKEQIVLKHRGIPGDMYIYYRPVKNRITDIQMRPSVKNKQLTIKTEAELSGDTEYLYSALIKDRSGKTVKQFESPVFKASELKNGEFIFSETWENPELWDLDTPENIYTAVITLKNIKGDILDESLPFTFGFREFRIEGRNFILNDRIIHLRFLKVDSAMKRADHASYPICLKTCRRLKENGFNAFIWGNYEFTQGKIGYMDGILNAADKTGVLESFTLPHIKDFSGNLDDPERRRRYQELTKWLIRRVQNHPSVVLYAMNHNTSSYSGDQNPLKIDGIFQPVENEPRKQCLTAEAIASSFDPTRPVYHHHSGMLGQMYTINTYLNWAPPQEKSDWFQHWSEKGKVPLFCVEWGIPHMASWSSYRGPEFIWMCNAFQSIWDCEFASPFIGQPAYEMTPTEQDGIKREEAEWATGKPFNFGALMGVLINGYRNFHGIQAYFIKRNWPALRSWGLSAILPWDQDQLYQCRTSTPPMPNPDRFKNLKSPGIVPDIFNRGSQFLYHYNDTDFKPTPSGTAMKRWNKPVIGYIAGAPEHFTAQNANFYVSEPVTKQLAVINDAHKSIDAKIHWALTDSSDKIIHAKDDLISVSPGLTRFTPIEFSLPAPGTYKLTAEFAFSNGSVQYDTINLNVLPELKKPQINSKVALFDPANKTAELLDHLGVEYDIITADSNLDPYKIIVIGKGAVTKNNKLPSVFDKPAGKSILFLEQNSEVLSKRFGFRVQEYGLRKAYVRAPLHPLMRNTRDSLLKNWRGASTLLPPYTPNLPEHETSDPKYIWCGFENKHVWRCGNTGSVASVLIEKPVKGNWTSIIDGGFDLQYAPLLEYKGKDYNIIFCQMNITGRTETEPQAIQLAADIFSYLDSASPHKLKKVMTIGSYAAELAEKLNLETAEYNPALSPENYILLISDNASEAATWVSKGGKVLGLALDRKNAEYITGNNINITPKKGWCRLIKDFSENPVYSGISNAELHWRTDLNYNAINNTSDDSNEALQSFNKGQIVLCQITPEMFDIKTKPYLRTTQRRAYYLISQLLTNMGASAVSPLLKKISAPARITFISLANDKWKGKVDKEKVGRDQKWFAVDLDDSDWERQVVPGFFEDISKEIDADYQGYYWYRLHLNIPSTANNGKITLDFGPVDDESWIWINGHFLGEISSRTGEKEFWAVDRKYDVNPEYINWDKDNVITVLCNDTYLKGGIRGKAYYKSGQGAWLDSYYIQIPQKDDDPYRYYRW